METSERTSQNSFFQSNTAKMMLVGALTLALLIPLSFVENLIQERANRQKEVILETNNKWGDSIYFYGPILKVPYKTYSETVTENEKTKEIIKQKVVLNEFAYFFPNNLKNKTDVNTNELKRSNYESVVFTSKMKFEGEFIKPDFSPINIPSEDIQWDKAKIIIQTSNLKSIKNEVKIKLNNGTYTFEPIYNTEKNTKIEALETNYIDASTFLNSEKVNFDFDIVYKGSQNIRFVPIGKITQMSMNSNWASPKFDGRFLPDSKSKKINENGFFANWKVLHINRAFSQQFFGTLPDLSKYTFGVDFIIPVDQYQQNERAAKYGFLVIGLTFLIFFLIQSISKINIHIFNYSMIGLALIMFYTLLISITEHSSFLKAYLFAGIAVVILILLYSISILKNLKFPLFIGASLTSLYTFIFIIIQL